MQEESHSTDPCRMEDLKIQDFECSVLETGKSRFVEPFRMTFLQNGSKRVWDAVKSHQSVAILIHNIDQQAIVLVKQFRPPVYYARLQEDGDGVEASAGVTLELCAGIVDKDKSWSEIAAEEVLEETGYKVSAADLEEIAICRHNVGLLGTRQTLYYAQVRDSMRVGAGGGHASEGEFIEVVHLPVAEMDSVMKDEKVEKPAGFLFALVWLQRRLDAQRT